MSDSQKGSFWTTIPGCLTAIAGMITAIAGLISVLYATGVFTSHNAAPTPQVSAPAHGVNLNGTWQAASGFFTINQSGAEIIISRITEYGTTFQVGSGTVNGQTIELTFSDGSRDNLTVSADGNTLNGTEINTNTGESQRVILQRK